MSSILKIGKAHNEAGKRFFASENLTEINGVLYYVDDIIFHSGNFNVGNSFKGDGSSESPFDWVGFSVQNGSGIVLANNVSTVKQGIGTTLSVSDNGIATISVDLSNYSGTTVSIAGNGSKLLLNGVWSLTDGNSVKIASENDKHTAYLFSNDLSFEYPVLKAKSNRSGTDREYLLLSTEGMVDIDVLPVATTTTLGVVYVNGNNLSLSANGLIGWTGFTAKSSNGTLLSSVIKELKAGENVEFAVAGNVLTINASVSQTVTVDSSLSSTSTNPVQNKVVYSELNKKITDPGSGSNGQFLSKTANGYQWVDAPQGGGTNITVDTALSTTSTNPVQNKVVTAELNKKISDPGSGQVGQILSKTANGYQWVNQNTGGSSGTGVDISQILIQRPVSDYELFPRIEASNSANFSDSSTIVIDPSEDPSDKGYIKVYDAEGEWIDFPTESGLGTPFDGTSISVNTSKFSGLVQPYYVRYCWKVAGGSESNYKSTMFPAVHAPAPLMNASGDGVLPTPGTDDIGKIPVVKDGTEGPYYDLEEVNFTGGGSTVKRFTIQRPVSDLELFPLVKASQNPAFSSCQTIEPRTNSEDAQFIKVFTGEEWMDFPSEDGLGSPFDGCEISIDTSKFAGLTEPYYIKYCWTDSEGSESNYKSTMFPSAHLSGSQIVKNPVAGFDFGLVIRTLTQEEFDSLESKDGNTLYFVTE